VRIACGIGDIRQQGDRDEYGHHSERHDRAELEPQHGDDGIQDVAHRVDQNDPTHRSPLGARELDEVGSKNLAVAARVSRVVSARPNGARVKPSCASP
jgi:hypothetical protein